jgi:CheY-like chemotaxis protein
MTGAGGSLRVLVVEDERIISLAVASMLRNMGHTVAACVARGEDALEAARDLSPDLVLLDIHLEGDMDGIAVARALRERGGPPVAFTSAYTDEATRSQALAVGPLAFLSKPVSPQDFRAVVAGLALPGA